SANPFCTACPTSCRMRPRHSVVVPFYLAHRRLMSIEREQMLEVEGGTKTECLGLIRHEVGHAVQNGFALHRRKRWQRLFGKCSTPYPSAYRPNPASRDFVQHLEGWYAQAHPAEDWAETFAVWMGSRAAVWRKQYAGWGALEKLEYVQEVMEELSGVRPPVLDRRRPYAVTQLRKTLKHHYREKRAHYGYGASTSSDPQLLRVFAKAPGRGPRRPAANFLRRHRSTLRDLVAEATETHPLTVDWTLKDLIGRSQELGLFVQGPAAATRDRLIALLTARTVHLLYRGRRLHAL
ncbi:MAG: putative zinc-binding metallopeptidase, partial [Myxococcota bacterium]